MDNKTREDLARIKLARIPNVLDAQAVRALICRVTGSDDYAQRFVIRQYKADHPHDAYRMRCEGESIVVEANTGVAACAAFNRYLKEVCHCFYGPLTQNMALPAQPPRFDGVLESESPFLYRYFLNYCTFSYTYLFAGWKEWERLTDFMLLSGVNLYLNIVGHEIVWRDTLRELGYAQAEVDEFLCGPAYLPWQWMGNMTGFGGNLTENWYVKQKALANRINDKMRAFSAAAMLPGYYGMAPADFQEKFPQSAPLDQGLWCGIRRPALLDVNDALFDRVADVFYQKTKEHFGSCAFFSADPFHEGGRTDSVDLGRFGRGVLSKMQQHNPGSIWFLQGWQRNPRREMLTALEKESVLVGNLSADNNYGTGDDYCGYPWLYLTTPNFGGTRKMSGNMRGLLSEPLDILDKPDDNAMVGVGMTMEAVEIDEIIFDLFASVTFADARFSQRDFLRTHITARYGTCSDELLSAFEALANNIYTNDGANLFGSKESSLCPRPSLKAQNASTWGEKRDVPYGRDVLPGVTERLLGAYDALADRESYRFDLADIARQMVSDRGWALIKEMDAAYEAHDKQAFRAARRPILRCSTYRRR